MSTPTTVQYYFAPNSPWTYLGHLRFWDIARKHRATIEVLPMDLGGKVSFNYTSLRLGVIAAF